MKKEIKDYTFHTIDVPEKAWEICVQIDSILKTKTLMSLALKLYKLLSMLGIKKPLGLYGYIYKNYGIRAMFIVYGKRKKIEIHYPPACTQMDVMIVEYEKRKGGK